ncbi:MAG: hypothetical protein ACOYN0_03330 [Phycisphaerales bacterium]
MAKKVTKRAAKTNLIERLRAIPGPLATVKDADALHSALAEIQNIESTPALRKLAKPATKELVRLVDASLAAPFDESFEPAVMFALKLLAFFAQADGAEAIVRAAKLPYAPESYMWSIVLDFIGSGHPHASKAFAALKDPLPEGFLAISLLDAGNTACREYELEEHPFDSADGAARLEALLCITDPDELSYAVSACASLPFIAPRRASKLMKIAAAHDSPLMRMEVAWVQAKLGKSAGVKFLASAALNPHDSTQACDYLAELGLEDKVPEEAKHPDFVAMASMCNWLAHPNEYGEPPTSISLFDSRSIYWPPAGKKVRAWLFEYTYGKSAWRKKKETGVGIAGPMLWALFDEAKPEMKPETLYGLYCEVALAWNDDKRAPNKLTGAKGWKLIAAGKK